jgi:hypothetical protein
MFQALDTDVALSVPQYVRERRLLREEQQEYACGLE